MSPTKANAGKKRGHDEKEIGPANGDKAGVDQPPAKQSKTDNNKRSSRSKSGRKASGPDKSKLDAILSAYGVLPLQDLGLDKPNEATPDTILALVLHAMLTSARISHQLAYKSVKAVIEAGYHKLETLKKSTWEERTVVLTEGGYTRYREKTATALGELAEFVEREYKGDLNNLLKRANSSPAKTRKHLQEIKGIGKVGVDIFFDTAQNVWPSLAPFIDPRSMETAERCGLGRDVNAIWEMVNKEPEEMCKLASALTIVRLEKKEHEFQ